MEKHIPEQTDGDAIEHLCMIVPFLSLITTPIHYDFKGESNEATSLSRHSGICFRS